MWNAITLHEPEHPVPVPMPPENRDITYGGALFRLDDFNYVDERLRLLVCRCMMRDPAKRPSVADLHEVVRQRLDEGFPEETDEQTRQQNEAFFGGREDPNAADWLAATLQRRPVDYAREMELDDGPRRRSGPRSGSVSTTVSSSGPPTPPALPKLEDAELAALAAEHDAARSSNRSGMTNVIFRAIYEAERFLGRRPVNWDRELDISEADDMDDSEAFRNFATIAAGEDLAYLS